MQTVIIKYKSVTKKDAEAAKKELKKAGITAILIPDHLSIEILPIA